jgi:hypothetical protein
VREIFLKIDVFLLSFHFWENCGIKFVKKKIFLMLQSDSCMSKFIENENKVNTTLLTQHLVKIKTRKFLFKKYELKPTIESLRFNHLFLFKKKKRDRTLYLHICQRK